MARENRLTVAFDDFGWQELTAEAHRQGVSTEELVAHAAMYYLADLESGRLATRVLREADEADGVAERAAGCAEQAPARFRRGGITGGWG